MKQGAKNRSNTRKILNNNNVHTHARTHARTQPHFDGIDRSVHDSVYNTGLIIMY